MLFPIFQPNTDWAERKIKLVWWQLKTNIATEVQVSLCNFCENEPVMEGSILTQQEFLEAGIEMAVGLISNSATY